MRAPRRPTACGLDGSHLTIGLAVGASAFAVQLTVDFGLRVPALALAFGVVVGMLVQRVWPSNVSAGIRGQLTRNRIGSGTAALGVAALCIGFVRPLISSEASRQSARATIDRMAPGRLAPQRELVLSARDELSRAAEVFTSNASIWSDLSYADASLVQFDVAAANSLGREAERAADFALAISREVAEFWIRRGVALDLQGRWVEAGNAFVEALKLAPNRAGVWYQQAVHLSLKSSTREQAIASVGLCLRLDPGNAEAHALRQRLAERSLAR